MRVQVSAPRPTAAMLCASGGLPQRQAEEGPAPRPGEAIVGELGHSLAIVCDMGYCEDGLNHVRKAPRSQRHALRVYPALLALLRRDLLRKELLSCNCCPCPRDGIIRQDFM